MLSIYDEILAFPVPLEASPSRIVEVCLVDIPSRMGLVSC
jgi:hypothetical protein